MTNVLLYHDVVPRELRETVGFAGPLAARYKLEPSVFLAHLDALAAAGLRVGLVDDDPPAQVALSFDDGGASARWIAAALEERGWRAYFFVPTGWIGTRGFLERAAVRELAERGHLVGSHSDSHPTYMGALPRVRLDDEWRRSREVLAELLGSPPAAASVPGGFLSGATIASAAAAGYSLLMTSEPVARVEWHDGMAVVGRYSIRADTPARRALAYARGEWGARTRLWVEWRVKHAAKRASPPAYQRARRLRARL